LYSTTNKEKGEEKNDYFVVYGKRKKMKIERINGRKQGRLEACFGGNVLFLVEII